MMKLLPIEQSKIDLDSSEQADKTVALYAVEPSPAVVLEALIRDYITDKIRGAILESEAAEHSARMMAMKSATDNATELVGNLTLLRNKLRQTSITNQLLEITSAVESSEYV